MNLLDLKILKNEISIMKKPSKKLIIDTNILLLIIIGKVGNQKYLKDRKSSMNNNHNKRVGHYDKEDYFNVIHIMNNYKCFYITSYIATEVSNLINLKGNDRKAAFKTAAAIFSVFKQVETDIKTDSITGEFEEKGITDNSLINLSDDYMILTNDKELITSISYKNPQNMIPFKILN